MKKNQYYSTIKKIIYSLLSFIYFYCACIFVFTLSYFFHFRIIHNTYPIGNNPDYFTEWCPFPFRHNTPMMEISQWDSFILIPLGLSFITSVIFFFLERKGRWILILVPIIITVILTLVFYLT